jgi:hypothetical protein
MALTNFDRRALDDLRTAAKTAATAVKMVEQQLGRVDADKWHNDLWKQQTRADIRQRGIEALAAIRETTEKAKERLDANIPPAKKSTPPGPQIELARQIAEQRAWQRALTLLQSGVADPRELVGRAIQADDLDALNAYRAELPAYLEAQAGTSDPQMRKLAADQSADLVAAIDDARYPHMTEWQRQAIDAEKEVKAGYPYLVGALDLCESNLDHPDELGMFLGWVPDEANVIDASQLELPERSN